MGASYFIQQSAEHGRKLNLVSSDAQRLVSLLVITDVHSLASIPLGKAATLPS